MIQQKWPYIHCHNYLNQSALYQAIPHLHSLDTTFHLIPNQQYIVIRSSNQDNIHKYGIWTSTVKNMTRLNQLYNQSKKVYLFFSSIQKEEFIGLAEMISEVKEELFPYWWGNHNLKFQGFFIIQWKLISNIKFSQLYNLIDNEHEYIFKGRDCSSIPFIFAQLLVQNFRQNSNSVFANFQKLDERELKYLRNLPKVPVYVQVMIPKFQHMNNQYNFDFVQNPIFQKQKPK